jgi:hypothetical protein
VTPEGDPSEAKKARSPAPSYDSRFRERRVYREAEVNSILSEFHEDVATLRRKLVEMGLLMRYRGEYPRPEQARSPQAQ